MSGVHALRADMDGNAKCAACEGPLPRRTQRQTARCTGAGCGAKLTVCGMFCANGVRCSLCTVRIEGLAAPPPLPPPAPPAPTLNAMRATSTLPVPLGMPSYNGEDPFKGAGGSPKRPRQPTRVDGGAGEHGGAPVPRPAARTAGGGDGGGVRGGRHNQRGHCRRAGHIRVRALPPPRVRGGGGLCVAGGGRRRGWVLQNTL